MSQLRRLILVRHGESTARSSEHLIGRGDPDLSPEGEAQIRRAGRELETEVIDLVVASPLRRSWRAARLLAGPHPIRLERELREIDFGHWEGLKPAEVEAAEPVLYSQWLEGAPDFEYPGGERRRDFRDRVEAGYQRLEESGARGVLLVAHKGVIRTLVEGLTGTAPSREEPALGEVLTLTRIAGEEGWRRDAPGEAVGRPRRAIPLAH